MHDKAKLLEEKIAAEEERWLKLSKKLEEQFLMQQGAYLGRIELLKEMLKDLNEQDNSNDENE